MKLDGQMKPKKKCLQRAGSVSGIKKYLMCKMKYSAVSLMPLMRSWTSCSDTCHHEFNQIPADKKSKPDNLC